MKKTTEVKTTEENAVELMGHTEVIDEDVNQVEGTIQDDGSHQCDTCPLEFATCNSVSVQYGIDHYPDATGKEADRVISCGSFTPHNLAEVVAYIPSEKDHIGPRFTRLLPVPVPQDMLASYAQEMVRIHGQWVKTKLDAKAFAKSCKSVTDQCEERELELAEIINAGAVEEEIPVNWIFDYIHNVKRLIRLDDMTVVEEKTLTADDMQPDLLQHALSNVPDSSLEEQTDVSAIEDEVQDIEDDQYENTEVEEPQS